MYMLIALSDKVAALALVCKQGGERGEAPLTTPPLSPSLYSWD